MKTSVQIGNTKYSVVLNKKGGKVFVGRDKKVVFKGQWIPLYNSLILKGCPFPELTKKIESKIIESGISSDVVWPYISEKYR